jgi:hypothetical protein
MDVDGRDKKNFQAPGDEPPELESSPLDPANKGTSKQERRFLLKLDLYLITWAWFAYLIKVCRLLVSP